LIKRCSASAPVRQATPGRIRTYHIREIFDSMKTQSDDALRKDRPLCASKCNTYNLFVFGDKADLSIPITWYRLCGTFDDSMILDLSISIQSCSLSGRNGRDDFRQRSTVKRCLVGWPRGLRSRFALMTISPQEKPRFADRASQNNKRRAIEGGGVP
jgi:hypothetical protein